MGPGRAAADVSACNAVVSDRDANANILLENLWNWQSGLNPQTLHYYLERALAILALEIC